MAVLVDTYLENTTFEDIVDELNESTSRYPF